MGHGENSHLNIALPRRRNAAIGFTEKSAVKARQSAVLALDWSVWKLSHIRHLPARIKNTPPPERRLELLHIRGGRYFPLRNSLRLPVNEGAAFAGANGPCYADADSLRRGNIAA